MKKRRIIFCIVWGALAAFSLLSLGICRALSGSLADQRAAERWKGENELEFAQLSCFMNAGDRLTLTDIYTFRGKLQNRLTEASFTAEEGGSLFTDAWCAFGTLDAAGEHGSGKANAVAVGGNFFHFHPMRLVSGSYLREDDVMDDRVLLDRELAWRLYGGDDLAGLTVTLGPEAKPFVIAGVVDHDDGFFSAKARQDGMTVYLSYSAWSAMAGEGGAQADCYELVMPQPVEGFAEGIVKELFPLGGGETLNNTARFSLKQCWENVRQFGTRSMHLTSVIYPEWENAARGLEDWCSLFFALAVLFAVFPSGSGFVLFLIGLVRLKDRLARTLPGAVSGALDRSRQRRWERNHNNISG
ncbi:MAG: ABC transporter permease [Oscillospiraceae bacterium]|nr:ABC transporter permease [Oscillospiraceae bacterium]